ncbi:hypothetical protein ACFVKB_41860 [Rhodococcus sp. NPDC127530]|uniref:hypothetical protein n=1 Tax=unclassified Rhodococcus (in: high G+C Gram-positive bacteria) TaxID=192944 RepID=UPI0036280297
MCAPPALFGYSSVPATFVCVITVVAAVLTATAALARVLTRAPDEGVGTRFMFDVMVANVYLRQAVID